MPAFDSVAISGAANLDLMLSVVAILAAFGLIAMMFLDGIRLAQRGILTGNFSIHIDAITVAICRIAYRAGLSYVGLANVRQVLIDDGLLLVGDGATGNPSSDERSRRPELINETLANAAALPWGAVLSSKSFVPVFDLGYADYATMAFRLFGLRIEALYYMYFALLTTSCAVFGLAYYQNPAGLWSLCLMLATLRWLKLYQKPADTQNMDYVYAQHFLSTLTVIPAFHLILGVTSAQPLTWISLLACIIQAFIIVTSFRIRYAASWVLFAIAAAAAAWFVVHLNHAMALPTAALQFAVAAWRGDVQAPSGAIWHEAIADIAGLWLVLATAFVFAWQSWRYRRRLSPIYKGDEIPDSYPRWHAAYVGLAMDPVTWRRNMRRGQSDRLEDHNVLLAAYHWLQTTPEGALRYPGLRPELQDFHLHKWRMKWRAYDELIRQAFFAYLRQNIGSIPGLYLIHKPRALLGGVSHALGAVMNGLRRQHPIQAAFLGIALSVFGIAAFARVGSGAVAGAIICLLVASPAPQIWAYTIAHGLADQSWIAFFAAWALCLWAMAAIFAPLMFG
ncbi:MAG: hypothetical protein HYR63_14925 [Proteobacteria bacterium]|nr:hypothetical protein [Pseudomonadota bacterium]